MEKDGATEGKTEACDVRNKNYLNSISENDKDMCDWHVKDEGIFIVVTGLSEPAGEFLLGSCASRRVSHVAERDA